MLFGVIGITIGGFILFIVRKLTSKSSITNQNIKTSPTNKKQNKALLCNVDELTKIINLDNTIDNNRVVTNHKLNKYRKDRVDITIKKQREAEIKEKFQRENKIIRSKGELCELINNELKLECNVILKKSILVEYLNDKIESEQMKIQYKNNQLEKSNTKIEYQKTSNKNKYARLTSSRDRSKIIQTTVIKSETSEDIYESKIESEDETGQKSQVLTIDEMVGNIIKNLHKNEYGDCKSYTFEEHNEIIKSYEKNCKFDFTKIINNYWDENINTKESRLKQLKDSQELYMDDRPLWI